MPMKQLPESKLSAAPPTLITTSPSKDTDSLLNSSTTPDNDQDTLLQLFLIKIASKEYPQALSLASKLLELDEGNEMIREYVWVLKERIGLDVRDSQEQEEGESGDEEEEEEDDEDEEDGSEEDGDSEDSDDSEDDDDDDDEESEEESSHSAKTIGTTPKDGTGVSAAKAAKA
ncbi:hypothetical protein HDV05_007967 [Chytridiales sp. JEL 0842]|nr:hypothetical protein HDV05_007967 [Chytridiales sp. JEL 0842]